MIRVKRVIIYFLVLILCIQAELVFFSKINVHAETVAAIDEEKFVYEDSVYAFGNGFLAFIDDKNDLYMVTLSTYAVERKGDAYPCSFKDDINHPKKIQSNVKSVSFSYNILYFLKEDGTVWQYGEYDENLKRFKSIKEPVLVLNDVVKLGNYFETRTQFAAIKKDGSLWTWGSNYNNSLLQEGEDTLFQPTLVMNNVKDISFSYESTLVLKEDGSVIDSISQSVVMNGVKKLYGSGRYHYSSYAAIKEDDSLWMWGNNQSGQLGIGSIGDIKIPHHVADDVKNCFINKNSGFVKKDGSLYAMGVYSTNQGGTLNQPIFKIDGKKIDETKIKLKYDGSWPYRQLCAVEPVNVSVRKYQSLSYSYNGIDMMYIIDNTLHFKGNYCSGGWYSPDYTDDTILSTNIKMDNETVVKGEKLSLTEEEIYRNYPESLSNETDDLFNMTFQHCNTLLSKRDATDDFLTSYKYLTDLKNFSDVWLGIIDSKYITNRYIDDIIMELLDEITETSDVQEKINAYLETYHTAADELSKDISTFKKVYKYTQKISEQAEVIYKFKGLFNITKEEDALKMAELIKELHEDNKISNFLEELERGIDTFDFIFLVIQMQNINVENVDLLIDIFPEKSLIAERLIKLKRDITSDQVIVRVGIDWFKDEVLGFITESVEDISLYLMTGKVSKSLTYMFAKESIKFLGKQINAALLDNVMNATLYTPINGTLYTELVNRRASFEKMKSEQNYDHIKEEIGSYRMIFNITRRGFINQLKTLEDEGTEADKETTKILIKELEQTTYEQYLNNCLRKIRAYNVIFDFIVENNEAYLVRVNVPQTKSLSMKENSYNGNLVNGYLTIPDTFAGLPVVGIKDGAIPDCFEMIYLGNNIRKIDNSLKDLKNLKILKTKSNLSLSESAQIPQNIELIYTTSDSVNDKLKDTFNVKYTLDDIMSISIENNPKNMFFQPSEAYKSDGMSIKVTDVNGRSEVLNEGWLEYLNYENDEVILNVVYGGASTKIPLILNKENVEYTIRCIDESGNEISNPIIKKNIIFTTVSENAPELNNYISTTQQENLFLGLTDNVITFEYKRIMDFDEKVYILKEGEATEYKVNNDFTKNITVSIEDESIFTISANKILGLKKGISYISAKDEYGNKTESMVIVEELEKEEINKPDLPDKDDIDIDKPNLSDKDDSNIGKPDVSDRNDNDVNEPDLSFKEENKPVNNGTKNEEDDYKQLSKPGDKYEIVETYDDTQYLLFMILVFLSGFSIWVMEKKYKLK